MPLGVLNNISAIYAENYLNQSQSSLQTTLQQLSSGSRINSGADDAAGLSLADGLGANAAALDQSSLNAQQGVGFLQVADGALSQINALLTRGITLATEVSNGTLNTTQDEAANQEYQSILAEINNIGTTTTFNNEQIFDGATGSTTVIYTGDSSTEGGSTDTLSIKGLTSASVGDAGGTITTTASVSTDTYKSVAVDPSLTYSGSLVFKQGTAGTAVTVTLDSGGDTISQIASLINEADINGVSAGVVSASSTTGLDYLEINEAGANLVSFASSGANDESALDTATVALDFTAPSSTVTVGGIGYTEGTGEDLATTTLSSSGAAETALSDINTAITDVAAQRGYIGSQVNTLNAASNVESTQSENIISAQNSVTATDYGTASSNLSKYEILSQTGISALAQANSVQQEVLKLLQ
jgi:flagellin